MLKLNKITALIILLVACISQITNANHITSTEYNELIAEFQRCSNITPSKSGLSIRHRLAGEETRGHCFRSLNTRISTYVIPVAQAKAAAIELQVIADKNYLEKQLAIDKAALEARAAKNKSNLAIQIASLQNLKDKGRSAELAAALINFINFLDSQTETSAETISAAPVTTAVPVPTPAVEPTTPIVTTTPAVG